MNCVSNAKRYFTFLSFTDLLFVCRLFAIFLLFPRSSSLCILMRCCSTRLFFRIARHLSELNPFNGTIDGGRGLATVVGPVDVNDESGEGLNGRDATGDEKRGRERGPRRGNKNVCQYFNAE